MAYPDFKSYIKEKHIAEITGAVAEYVNKTHDGSGFHAINVLSLCDQEVENVDIKSMRCRDGGQDDLILMHMGVTADVVMLGLGTKKYEADRKQEWFTVNCSGILKEGLHDFSVLSVEVYNPDHFDRKTDMSEFMLQYISTDDLEDIADQFWEDYCADAIYEMWELPYWHILRKMHIQALEGELPDGEFGRMYFRRSTAKYMQHYYPFPKEMVEGEIPAGTMIINKKHFFMGTFGSVLHTIAHELVHWDRHRKFFEIMSLLQEGSEMMSCEAEPKDPSDDMTPLQKAIWWAEWQANALASRIVMPRTLFPEVIAEGFEACDPFDYRLYSERLEGALEKTAELFGVSKFAAKLRAIQLGYREAEGTMLYKGRNYNRPITFRRNALEKNQTYIIDEETFFKICESDNKLVDLLASGDFVFTGCTVCINDPLYVEQLDDDGVYFKMTEYARENADECCLVFEKEYIRKNDFDTEFYSQCFLSRKIEAAPYVDQKLTEDIGNQDKGERSRELAKLRKNNEGVAKVLRELPSSFGGSLKYHMEHSTRSGKKKVSSLWLAEETGLSEGYIDQLRNGERRVSLETVCAICIALHLLPPYSKDLIAKSHNGFLNNEEGLFGQQLIEDFYLEPLSDINEVLKEQGFQMWGKTEE